MAEQRPYRLSGTAADTRLSQTKIVVLLSLGDGLRSGQLGDDAACRTILRLLAGARRAVVSFSTREALHKSFGSGINS